MKEIDVMDFKVLSESSWNNILSLIIDSHFLKKMLESIICLLITSQVIAHFYFSSIMFIEVYSDLKKKSEFITIQDQGSRDEVTNSSPDS